jgi:hypothetical protein
MAIKIKTPVANLRIVFLRSVGSYSITRSALCSSDGEIVRPSVFAVFRLMAR